MLPFPKKEGLSNIRFQSLKGRKNFLKILKSPKYYSSYFLDLFWEKNSKNNYLGIIIPKRIEKRATRRNYLRRLIKYFFSFYLKPSTYLGILVIKIKHFPRGAARKEFRDYVNIEVRRLVDECFKDFNLVTD